MQKTNNKRLIEKLKIISGSFNNHSVAFWLGISPSLLNAWIAGRPITAKRAIEIERKTKGRIMRHEIRPDLYRGYVPEKESTGVANGN